MDGKVQLRYNEGGRSLKREPSTPSRVLYFPYISVPQTAWFSRVLLYWDEVGSIVPSPLANDLRQVSPYMGELVSAGLVRPIIPGTYEHLLHDAMIPFLEFASADPEIQRRAAAGFGSTQPSRGTAPVGTMMKIHGEKLGDMVGRELERLGLARKVARGEWFEHWYEVEARTASAFMAHLAASLGALEQIEMRPITDGIGNLATFAHSEEAARDPLALVDELRLGVLEQVLPGPVDGVPVAELVSFKEAHRDRLAAFRRRIESTVLDLATIESAAVREAKTKLIAEQLSDDVEDLVARMQERKWPKIVFGALCGIAGTAIPVGAAAATGALPLAAAGIPSLANAIYQARELITGTKAELRDPLAYAALARERLA